MSKALTQWRLVCLVAVCLLAVAPVTSAQTTVHVAVDGNDRNSGAADRPVATVARAVQLVRACETAAEIVIHEGVYPEQVAVGTRGEVSGPVRPRLTIRASRREDGTYEDVVFDGGARVPEATPVDGMKGVFRALAALSKYYREPQMWEGDTRTRYTLVADLAAVAAYPGSFWYSKTELYFHTSDDRPPGEHEIGLAKHDAGLAIWRTDVTVRGLKFRNYLVRRYSNGLGVRAERVTVEDCRAWNCTRGFQVGGTGPDVVIRRCRTDDCATGARLFGQNAKVEDCRFFNVRDGFLMPCYLQDDCGIHYYYPALGGEIRRNLVVGFASGIFIKCKLRRFVIENNTCIGGEVEPGFGVGHGSWHEDSVCRYNIIQGYIRPLVGTGSMQATTVLDHNCLWRSANLPWLKTCLEQPRTFGTGMHTIYADPRFVAPEAGDYRLLPDSPCARMGPDGGPAGALEVVPPDFKDVHPPRVVLSAAKPAVPVGGSGARYFERDPWHGGGRNLSRTLPPLGREGDWVTPTPEVTLVLGAQDACGRATQMKLKIGDGQWSPSQPIEHRKTISLPESGAANSVSVTVCDNAGNWSPPTSLLFRLIKEGPKLAGRPVMRANAHGVVFTFRTDRPCTAAVEYGADETYGTTFKQSESIDRRWSPLDGGEWLDIRTIPRTEHGLVLTVPAIRSGGTYHYRLVLTGEAGSRTATEDAVFTVTGRPKVWCVSPDGTDALDRGTGEAPWRTPQFAVDRALPGDRVILQPGIYPGRTKLTHGGVDGAAITIQAAERGTAVLDGRKRVHTCLQLEGAPHVVIDGLEVRWSKSWGIHIADSPSVTVRHCKIWNDFWFGWVSGSGVLVHRSPGFIADHNVIFKSEYSLWLLQSPGSRVTYNTITKNMYRGVAFGRSVANSVCRNNCLAFAGGIRIISASSEDRNDMATFDCDYNNVGTRLRPPLERELEFIRENGQRLPQDRLQLDPQELHLKNVYTKRFANLYGLKIYSFEDWQRLSGKDKHSIFKDPLFADIENRDFRLRPDSPNIGAGENGTTIGALGVKDRGEK